MSNPFLSRRAWLIVAAFAVGALVLLRSDTRQLDVRAAEPSPETIVHKTSMEIQNLKMHQYMVSRVGVDQSGPHEMQRFVQAYSAKDALMRLLAVDNAVQQAMQVMLGAFRASRQRAFETVPLTKKNGI